jgi:hypothetical protein
MFEWVGGWMDAWLVRATEASWPLRSMRISGVRGKVRTSSCLHCFLWTSSRCMASPATLHMRINYPISRALSENLENSKPLLEL